MKRSLIQNIIGRRALALIEFIVYGALLCGIGYGIFQGVLFFQEWQCRKNMSMINEAVDVYLTQPGSALKSLDDIKGSLKTSVKAIPKCPTVPVKYNYFFNVDEKRVRCCYHGVL
ncbi:MAG TPA: hypothetical protein PKW98_05580 [Candidatus Wallbacteria bacterium]|nr:MAG: hypothetical protein BWY32_01987 [bacterium ADurb.Bin243]HPG57268.1 hypothetical protein [Candidatus Wallbacteria bacterium]